MSTSGTVTAALVFTSLVAAPFLCSALIRLLDPVARHVDLVDAPDTRKRHGTAVSLAGGLAMFLAFAVVLLASGAWSAHYTGLLALMGLICGMGVLDDRRHLGASLRFAIQIAAALLLVWLGELRIEHLGAITGAEPVALGAWSIPFTVLCVVGLINAINMIDGLDGLAGSTVAVMLAGLIVVALVGDAPAAALGPGLFLAVVVGFLAHNFPRVRGERRKVFMGDSGSTMLGLALAWFAIDIAFAHQTGVPPMTLAWILALPVLDTVVLMTRRALNGRSPLSPDRGHVHHVLLRGGLSPTAIVWLVMGLSALTAGVGILGWVLGIGEPWLFAGWLGLGVVHLVVVRFAWRIAAVLRRRLRASGPGQKPHPQRSPLDGKPARR